MATNTSLFPLVRDDIDFDTLNATTKASLKTLSPQSWSYTEAPEPGVTLLEALTYGVADLAYRHTLPLNDLLTPELLTDEGLFPESFSPESSLTCSPVTLDDYRRALLDLHTTDDESGHFYFRDIQLISEPEGQHYQYWYNKELREFSFTRPKADYYALTLRGNYWLYLALHDEADRKAAEIRVNEYLNDQRNLGESVSRIQWLQPKDMDLKIEIELDDSVDSEQDVAQVLADIYRVAECWCTPPIVRYTTQQLQQQGMSPDDIMDGPFLLHGWIPKLPEQVDCTQPSTRIVHLLVNPLLEVQGVKSIRSLACNQDIPAGHYAYLWADDVANILSEGKKVALYSKGGIKKTASSALIKNSLSREEFIQTNPTILPPGRWRKPGANYSASELLPPCYGLKGPAESVEQQQLHQFMLPFEQLLSNGCQQLAKLPQLLSFTRQPGSDVWAEQWPLAETSMGHAVHEPYREELINFSRDEREDTAKELAIIDNLLGYFDRSVAVPGLSSETDYLASQQYYLSQHTLLAAQRSEIRVDRVSSLQKRIAARLGLDCSVMFQDSVSFDELPFYIIEHRKLMPAQTHPDFNTEQTPLRVSRQIMGGRDCLLITLPAGEIEKINAGQLIDLILPGKENGSESRRVYRCLIISYVDNTNNSLVIEINTCPQLERNIFHVQNSGSNLRWCNSAMWLQDMNYKLSVADNQNGLNDDEKRLDISPYPPVFDIGTDLEAYIVGNNKPAIVLEVADSDPIHGQIVMKKKSDNIWPNNNAINSYEWYFGKNSYVQHDRFSFAISLVFNRELVTNTEDPYAVENWIKTILQEEVPAHISVLMHWLSPEDFRLLGYNYLDWQQSDSSLGIHSYGLLRKLALGRLPDELTGIGSMHIADLAQYEEVTGASGNDWHSEIIEKEELFYVPNMHGADTRFSSLRADNDRVIADGQSQVALTLTLKDGLENIVPYQHVTFTVSPSGMTVGEVSEVAKGTGIYSAMLTSGTVAQTVSIGVKVDGRALALPDTLLTLDAGEPELSTSRFTQETKIVADGESTATMVLTLKDVHANPVVGMEVRFATDDAELTLLPPSSLKTDDKGQLRLDVSTRRLKVYLIKASFARDEERVFITGSVNLTGQPDEVHSNLSAEPGLLVANNTASKKITLALKDVVGNNLFGEDVVFFSTNDGVMSSTINNSDGTYTATLKGKKAGNAEITVTVNGMPFYINKLVITMTGDESTAQFCQSNPTAVNITITNTPPIIIKIVDANQNPLSGQVVTRVTVNWVNVTKASDNMGETHFDIVGAAWVGRQNYIFSLANGRSHTTMVHYNGG